MRPDVRRPCRTCGTPVIHVQETGIRAALQGWVEAGPISVFEPLDQSGSLIWERHPQLGWILQDLPRRRGYPLHRQHKCKTSTRHNERTTSKS